MELNSLDKHFLLLCIEIAEEQFKDVVKYGTAGSVMLLSRAKVLRVRLGGD